MGRVIGGAAAGLVAIIVLIAMAAAGAVTSLFADQAGGGGPICLGILDSTDPAPAGLTPEQAANATIIILVGQRTGVPQRGWVIAIATAMQESNLVNLGHLGEDNDHDSLGLFQQRPSMGWGSPEQILNPAYAATVFYERLLQVPGWEHLRLTVAAQEVQRSAYPNAYARHERRANQIVDAYLAGTLPSCVPPPVGVHGWVPPVPGEVISGFRTADRPSHDGVDIPAPHGTVIYAAAAGTVVTVRCNIAGNSYPPDGSPSPCDRDGYPGLGGCGWYLQILHDDPQAGQVVTRYCHLLQQPAVAVGQQVTAGQPVGLVGSSGNSSGPHLHYEVHLGHHADGGNAIDPTPFMADRGAPLD
ncbi:MAG: peptidoglycan DD-metalloendopeptidase family protein [Micromonosporaceae bacterium]|nr:peptidoglycan DD-metalloendopeptidase family protein [Micromonosporaceae bacterium]